MALNSYYSEGDQVSDIIENNLFELQEKLRKEKVEIDIGNFSYEFFGRCEYLCAKSKELYPYEDLPNNFGVQRGYNGGGIHGSLQKTEIHRMTKSRQPKAFRLLNLFEKTFWNILEDVDSIDEQTTGEEKPNWERLTI